MTQLPWTHHLIILSQTRRPEEREFYMLVAIKEHWTKREFERQIQSGAILRSAPATKSKLSSYVEAPDRDVKKPHERPSIGVLLCASKAVLRKKLHELYTQLTSGDDIVASDHGPVDEIVQQAAAPS